ncbi:hypothetical protein G195_003182 [Phytophthora kernoviae 00238/432]|uniref:Amino acid transporter n=1 Tax=Phytophthora kernoviae 00238/432 TaxID=1284355 RepID=A0A8J4W731_9STRA|nr:hypothetical protein G195_003182 [Phytophthora kernoviae 00238/432]
MYNPITGMFERAGYPRYSKSKSVVSNPQLFNHNLVEPDTNYPNEVRRCHFFRQSTTQIMLGAIAGLLLGILLSHLKVSPDVGNLVNLPGKVFLQVLKCFVIPMVFTSLSTTVADLVLLGKVSIIGTRMALLFTESSREVPRSLLQFVVTIGCTIHKNGSAIYFPCALVFLVATAENSVELGWAQLVLIVLLSVLGSMSAAPIPNASVVIIYSIWSTIYPSTQIPASFSYLVAISWFLGRFVTVCNVIGDGYVARILAEQVEDEDVDHNEA